MYLPPTELVSCSLPFQSPLLVFERWGLCTHLHAVDLLSSWRFGNTWKSHLAIIISLLRITVRDYKPVINLPANIQYLALSFINGIPSNSNFFHYFLSREGWKLNSQIVREGLNFIFSIRIGQWLTNFNTCPFNFVHFIRRICLTWQVSAYQWTNSSLCN